jgi:hypothetical protein
MLRMIDQIRASKLPSNMMQFAARGALQVSPAENIEILVYLARHNQIFGDIARMTLAGWDEKASLAAASSSQTAREVLDYMISPDKLRPKLLPALLENPSVSEQELVKFSISASQESIQAMLKSARVRASNAILDALKANPYLKKEESDEIGRLLSSAEVSDVTEANAPEGDQAAAGTDAPEGSDQQGGDLPDEAVSAYLAEHAGEIAVEEGKPFQPVGGIIDILGSDYFPVSVIQEIGDGPDAAAKPEGGPAASVATATGTTAVVGSKPGPHADPKRLNSVQKIKALDVKGRIQLALKGNKEERSLLIRDGTKVVALAVLEAPKLSDGEVEKFASQKNVLESVLRAIPLKRRFMKNYIVVRNLVSNPRTPLDLGLGLMKNLHTLDLKNLSANKEVSDTIRKLALKMYKQKLDMANKK